MRLLFISCYFAAALSSLGGTEAGGGAEATRHLPALASPDAWQAPPAGTEAGLAAAGTHLEVAFEPEVSVRLLLREPVVLPDEVRDLSFLAANNGDNVNVKIHVLIEDAAGMEYVFNTRTDKVSIKSPEGEYGMTSTHHRSTENRHHTPGLRHPDIQRTIRPAEPNRPPQRPFTWTGLLIESRAADARHPPRGPRLYFRGFTVSSLKPNDSNLYYQFDGRECMGEIDGLPTITPGQFWWWPGAYRIAWDVRDRFAGQPFLFGGEELHATEDGNLPLAVQLARHIEIPVREKGTYWVRVRVHRTDVNRRYKSHLYPRVEHYEYRLDVLEGEGAGAVRSPGPSSGRGPAPLRPAASAASHAGAGPGDGAALPGADDISAGDRGPYHFIRIAPERDDLVYAADEPLIVPVAADAPADGDFMLKLEARSSSRGDTVFTAAGKPGEVSAFDLRDQPPGGYVLEATLIDAEGQPFDVARRLVARRDPDEQKLAPIPDSVPTARELLTRDAPMFHLDATYHARQRLDNPAQAWEKGFKPFLDEAGTLSKDIEVTVHWCLSEPVPGVFDWGETDRFLDYAHEKGLQVLLRLDFRAESVPEWLPPYFVRTREGRAFGHTAYLFHGMTPNFFHAPELRAALERYLQAAVRHFRGHPAVQGYYWVAEHPGDAPWSGFIGGYSDETIAGFREYLSGKIGESVDDYGRRLRATMGELDGPPHREADSRLRLAWLRYRQDALDSASRQFVEQTREIDPKRLLMIYSSRKNAAWFAEHGCMTANGGTHDPLMPGYLGMALDGFQMRNEEISPRYWSGTGPYQLDATVFHAAVAGGAHTHCKAFIATWKRFAECEDAPMSLGKYRDFQRIWRELRPTEVMPVEAFAFVDENSFLLEANSVGVTLTPGGWPCQEFAAAHLPVALARSAHWRKSKLLLATGEYVKHLAAATIDELVAYVEGGGCLYMRADAGRHCLERPGEEWVLLRRFGIAPPAGECEKDFYRDAVTVDGQTFRLRDGWEVEPVGKTLATFAHNDAPALSRVPFGKGSVIVRWAQTVVPPSHESSHSILADVAELAGVKRHALADHPRLWTNLLKHRENAAWYALVYAGPWHRPPDQDSVAGRAWWPYLPDGSYHVTELIHQRDLGVHDAETLRSKGLTIELQPREVTIWKMERK